MSSYDGKSTATGDSEAKEGEEGACLHDDGADLGSTARQNYHVNDFGSLMSRYPPQVRPSLSVESEPSRYGFQWTLVGAC